MWMGLLWATPFQLGPMKSPVWWSLSTQGLSSQQKGLLFVRTINWWWIIPNPLYSSGQTNGHGCMQTYTRSHAYLRPRRRQMLHVCVHYSDARSFPGYGLNGSTSNVFFHCEFAVILTSLRREAKVSRHQSIHQSLSSPWLLCRRKCPTSHSLSSSISAFFVTSKCFKSIFWFSTILKIKQLTQLFA